jgi:hypothetical protein
MTQFEFAGGGIPGFEHTQKSNVMIGKNNQDNWLLHITEHYTIALVADGCGSKGHSEIGSYLITKLLRTSLERAWIANHGIDLFEVRLRKSLDSARIETLTILRQLSQALLPINGSDGERASYSELVSEYLLCTVVGAFVTEQHAGFFSVGDGVIAINGDLTTLGPFEGNEPPYLAYSLLRTRWSAEELEFKIHRIVDAADLESFLIGTDGVLDLQEAADRTLPGRDEVVGPLEQFWTENVYFSKSGLTKKLRTIQSRRLNPANPQRGVEDGRLRDDTTFIVGRKRRENGHV